MTSDQQREPAKTRQAAEEVPPPWLQLVRRHVESLKFGTLLITVHDSQVTEIVRAERIRLARPGQSAENRNQKTGPALENTRTTDRVTGSST
jgi:hypothetical protein